MGDKKVSVDTVLHIAELVAVKIDLTEAEDIARQLDGIFSHFTSLQRLDTEGVPHEGAPPPSEYVLRSDEVSDSMHRKETLANAPGSDGEFIKIKPVFPGR